MRNSVAMTDYLQRLFTQPEGWAVLLSGMALMLWWGSSMKTQKAQLFQVRREYDFRNTHQYSVERDWYNNPFGGLVSSLPLNPRTINIRRK